MSKKKINDWLAKNRVKLVAAVTHFETVNPNGHVIATITVWWQ
jgi:hypothetical protein